MEHEKFNFRTVLIHTRLIHSHKLFSLLSHLLLWSSKISNHSFGEPPTSYNYGAVWLNLKEVTSCLKEVSEVEVRSTSKNLVFGYLNL